MSNLKTLNTDLSDSIQQEVAKVEKKRKTAWEKLDNDGPLSEKLKASGYTEAHLKSMSQQEIENISVGGTNDPVTMRTMELEAFDDGITGSLDDMLNIGIGTKLPKVRPRYPDKYHLYWATLSEKSSHPIEGILASKTAVYATSDDLDHGFESVVRRSADSDRIRIEEMVLMKTTVKLWEGAMKKFHHDMPAESQAEIYQKNKSKLIEGAFIEENDRVFNPNNNSSIYGAAKSIKSPKEGEWNRALS